MGLRKRLILQVLSVFAWLYHEEREFVLMFSAVEMYSEAVRDLLSGDTSPFRILDNAEKGTIAEKLTEETLRDWKHLRQLLSVYEAQRQVGGTLLNEASSRSHQILRLVILKGIDKGDIVTSGMPQTSKEGSVGKSSTDIGQLGRAKIDMLSNITNLYKVEDSPFAYDDYKVESIDDPHTAPLGYSGSRFEKYAPNDTKFSHEERELCIIRIYPVPILD